MLYELLVPLLARPCTLRGPLQSQYVPALSVTFFGLLCIYSTTAVYRVVDGHHDQHSTIFMYFVAVRIIALVATVVLALWKPTPDGLMTYYFHSTLGILEVSLSAFYRPCRHDKVPRHMRTLRPIEWPLAHAVTHDTSSDAKLC